jgi:pyruvate dehydrogenase E2 component (dihydrolipoamide acetyltransferase)
MPALGMSQDTGRLIAWLKQEGDAVEKGDLIMEVETDKTTVEVEAQASGTLSGIRAQAGDDVPVGDVIAYILAAGESAPAGPASAPNAPATTPPAPSVPPPSRSNGGNRSGVVSATPVAQRMAAAHDLDLSRVPSSRGRVTRADVEAYLANEGSPASAPVTAGGAVLASPKARRLVQEKQLDLAAIPGSGPAGAVIAADVLAYTPPAPMSRPATPAPSPDTATTPGEVQTGRMWRTMAKRLTESWQTVPHFYLKRDLDASAVIAWRTGLKARSNVKITYTDLLVKAVAGALRQHPHVNGTWNGEGVVFNADVNVGLAVAVDNGLLVPVIHQADTLGIEQAARRRAEIVNGALDGKLKPADLQGGTFSISNLGMFGIDTFDAIVNPPQAAILAVGRITERVVPVAGQMMIRPMMTLTLSCDHRVVDGAHGARFLDTLCNILEAPLSLLD